MMKQKKVKTEIKLEEKKWVCPCSTLSDQNRKVFPESALSINN